MTTLNVEWVEIPAGPCIIGLSQEEKRQLLKQLEWQIGGVRQLFDDNRGRLQMAKAALLNAQEQQQINLPQFRISRYPITLEQYVAYQEQRGLPVMSNDTRALDSGWGRLPKVLGYDEAIGFCDDLGVRLPSSIEWEKSARGPKGLLYPWGDKWDPKRANVERSVARKLPANRKPSGTWAAEVDAFPTGQSPYGVWDLVGNVQEWTSSSRRFPDRHGNLVEAHVVRRWPIKLSDDLAWVYNLLAVEHPNSDGQVHPDWYIGFRVVRD
jgi:formylglycine-generating enzyme required for sulfatase activity